MTGGLCVLCCVICSELSALNAALICWRSSFFAVFRAAMADCRGESPENARAVRPTCSEYELDIHIKRTPVAGWVASVQSDSPSRSPSRQRRIIGAGGQAAASVTKHPSLIHPQSFTPHSRQHHPLKSRYPGLKFGHSHVST